MRKHRHVDEEPLNLVPIMNLVTILIPFLLMSAQFVSLAVIDSTLPAITVEVTDTTPPEEKLNLSILITANGFTLTGTDKVLPPDSETEGPKIPCLDAGCRSPESYDYHALTERLKKVKDRYESEENVIFVPDGGVPYEVLVLTMDAARDDQEDKDDQGKPRTLFPFVVIAAGVQ